MHGGAGRACAVRRSAKAGARNRLSATRMSWLVGSSEGASAAVSAIAPLHVRDRANDQLLEHRPVEVGQPLEVQTGLGNPVWAELGQQGLPLVFLGDQVDHQLSTT